MEENEIEKAVRRQWAISLFGYIFYFPLLFDFIFISSYKYSFVYIYWVCT